MRAVSASGELDYIEWEPGEIRLKLYGDSAVLRYQARLRVSVKGSTGRAVTCWHTDPYEKRNGRWQIVEPARVASWGSVSTLGTRPSLWPITVVMR